MHSTLALKLEIVKEAKKHWFDPRKNIIGRDQRLQSRRSQERSYFTLLKGIYKYNDVHVA